MNQLTIEFSAPRARRRDPQTSRDAAGRASAFVHAHDIKILAAMHPALIRSGMHILSPVDGLTTSEIALRTALPQLTNEQVARRMSSLEERGRVKRNLLGETAKGVPIYEKRDGRALWWKAA